MTPSTSHPRLAVTLGDPTGIGPEIVAAAVAALDPDAVRRITIFGDGEILTRAAAAIGVTLPDVEVRGATVVATPGRPDDVSGAAQVAWLEDAIEAARAGAFGAIVTAPISKTWARRAGLAFPGHTELLAERFGAREVAMMFAGPRLRIVLATVHVPLAQVAATLDVARIVSVTRLLADALRRDHGVATPRLGVVGLNPHAGEGGMLGTEERDVIAPAIARASEQLGLAIDGPLIPDAAFRDAANGRWDGVVAMYHDQALIPVKLVDFEAAVNVTLGLPIVRTSPDHGTAYDLAGTGKARWGSFAASMKLAFEILERRTPIAAG